MTNEITINPIEIFKMEDNSITDAETIRQIALWSIKFNDDSLTSKIKNECQFAGLYPHVQKSYDIEPERKPMITHPGISMTPEHKITSQEPRVAQHYTITADCDIEIYAAKMQQNEENYQANITLDKYEIMLSANSKSIYPVGHLHKFINKIFDPKVGIAFFQIDKDWDVLWTRQFTGFFDKEKSEIYDGDYLEDETTIYLVEWNRNRTQWWLQPVNHKSSFDENQLSEIDRVFEYTMLTQSLGNGYFKRDDLLKIGNKYENPEIIK